MTWSVDTEYVLAVCVGVRFQYSVERWSGWEIEGSLCLEWWTVSRHVLADE